MGMIYEIHDVKNETGPAACTWLLQRGDCVKPGTHYRIHRNVYNTRTYIYVILCTYVYNNILYL